LISCMIGSSKNKHSNRDWQLVLETLRELKRKRNYKKKKLCKFSNSKCKLEIIKHSKISIEMGSLLLYSLNKFKALLACLHYNSHFIWIKINLWLKAMLIYSLWYCQDSLDWENLEISWLKHLIMILLWWSLGMRAGDKPLLSKILLNQVELGLQIQQRPNSIFSKSSSKMTNKWEADFKEMNSSNITHSLLILKYNFYYL
jgi:hypothetical protein